MCIKTGQASDGYFPLAERLGDKYLLVHAGALWMQTEEYMAKLKSSEKYSNILFIGKLPNEKSMHIMKLLIM